MEITGFSGPICATGSSPSTLLDAKDEKDFISFLKKKKTRSCIWEKGHCKRECVFHLAFLIFCFTEKTFENGTCFLWQYFVDSLGRTE